MFPNHWNEPDIIRAINEAYENVISVDGPISTGRLSNGMKIDLVIINGKIESAYPNLKINMIKLFAKERFPGSLILNARDKKLETINGLLADLQQSRMHENPNFQKFFQTKSIGSSGMFGEAYGIENLSENEVGIYIGVRARNENYREAPEGERLLLKKSSFLCIIKKWQEEEAEYLKDPKTYKAAIDRGEKVFEIGEESNQTNSGFNWKFWEN